jgi:phosphatidylglycerol:prolipoprotein diacylglycerol transferase
VRDFLAKMLSLSMDYIRIIPWYNISNGIGLIAAILLLENDFRRKGDFRQFPPLLIAAIISYIFGWFAGHLFAYIQMGYAPDGKALSAHGNYGFSFLGGLIGALLMFMILLRTQRIPIYQAFDRLAPVVPLAHAFGRLGCFLMGCCYGRAITVGGFSFQFPVQLVSAGFLILLFFILYFKKFSINRAYVYFISYPVFRFVIEFFRGDERGKLVTGVLSPAQELSLLITGITLIVFVFDKNRSKQHRLADQKTL